MGGKRVCVCLCVSIYVYIYIHIHMCVCIYIQSTRVVQPIACAVSFNLNLQSPSNWSLFNGSWQKRRTEVDTRLRFEIRETTLQMQ